MLTEGFTFTLLLVVGFAGASAALLFAHRRLQNGVEPPREPAAANLSGLAQRETPLPADEHWRRASRVVAQAGEQAATLRRHQKAAAGHLDSADYALQQLRDELSAVMPVAPRVTAVAGTLHQLKTPAQQAPRRRDSAAA